MLKFTCFIRLSQNEEKISGIGSGYSVVPPNRTTEYPDPIPLYFPRLRDNLKKHVNFSNFTDAQ